MNRKSRHILNAKLGIFCDNRLISNDFKLSKLIKSMELGNSFGMPETQTCYH